MRRVSVVVICWQVLTTVGDYGLFGLFDDWVLTFYIAEPFDSLPYLLCFVRRVSFVVTMQMVGLFVAGAPPPLLLN